MSKVDSKDYEARIAALEKRNHDLKMQIYYLNQNPPESQQSSGSVEEDALASRVTILLEDLSIANRRINDLESEKLEKQVVVSGKTNDIGAMSQTEENRKRERQAASLIAEQDALVIEGMEKEIERLKHQHQDDIVALKDLSEKITVLHREKAELNDLLINEMKKNERLEKQVAILVDQNRRNELLLGDASASMGAVVSSSRISTPDAEPGNKTISEGVIDEKSLEIATESPSVPSLGLGHHSNDHKDSRLSGVTPKDFLDFGAQTAWEELHTLRKENNSLRSQLKQERELIRSQEDALTRVRDSAQEMAVMEAEEIARLEREYEQAADERDQWQYRCRALDDQVRLLQEKLGITVKVDDGEPRGVLQVDSDINDDSISDLCVEEYSPVTKEKTVEENCFHAAVGEGASAEKRDDGSRSPTASPSRAKQLPVNSSHATRPKSSSTKRDISYYALVDSQKTAEIYRIREAELLRALEAVVLRYQELESKLYQLS